MTEEDFLKRWSRRKRAAEVAEPVVPEPSDAPLPQTPTKADEPVIDLESLPPIDSITSLTDVTAFLQKGVPLDLTRAALRRAWSADPAIREFVGLAENAWDFTDPKAMPGFGPLDYSPDQIRALVSDILGETKRAVEKVAELAPATKPLENTADLPSEPDTVETSVAPHGPAADELVPVSASNAAGERNAATHNEEPGEGVPARRSHGSALPQ